MKIKVLPKPKDWDQVMMQMALVIATMSKDPATKVGAVLVSPDRTRISVGYNGFPRQIPDLEKWWNNRAADNHEFTKYELVRHAEMNAMTQAKTDLANWTIYITHHPCIDCAKHLVAEGITRVLYYHDLDHLTMEIDRNKIRKLFKIAGVAFHHLQVLK
jgi:dCMP deaminase